MTPRNKTRPVGWTQNRPPRRTRRFPHALSALAALALAGTAACTAGSTGNSDPVKIQDSFTNSTAIRTAGPIFAKKASRIEAAADDAARIASRARRDGTRPLAADAVPLIFGAPEGRAFLALPRPRALAIGEPAALCPARAAAAGPTPAQAAATAIRRCLAQLEAAGGADPDCGCAVAAVDGALLLPPEALGYAPGVSARLVSPAAGLDLHLVADEAAAEDGARRLSLGPAAAPASALIRPDGSAELRLGDTLWTGRREAEGLVRGRFRERLILTRQGDGARAVLAVNWDPADWSRDRARVLAPLRG